jgi:hypothetical protein
MHCNKNCTATKIALQQELTGNSKNALPAMRKGR